MQLFNKRKVVYVINQIITLRPEKNYGSLKPIFYELNFLKSPCLLNCNRNKKSGPKAALYLTIKKYLFVLRHQVTCQFRHLLQTIFRHCTFL